MQFNLHTKVLVSLFGLFIISLASMGWVLLNDADNRLKEFKFLQAKSQARTLAENSEESLLVQDYSMLENLVKVAKSEEQYAFSAIISPSGLVFSHSNIDLVGNNIPSTSRRDEITILDLQYENRETREIIYPIKSGTKHLANAHIAYYLKTESNMSEETVKWLVQILILTLVSLSIGSLVITKHFTRHIVTLTRLVKHNRTDRRLAIDKGILSSTDEVGALANAFKTMSDQLVSRLEELEYQIKERDTARAANETKSAFLANVSHELRTPLNAIIGYSEILFEEAIEINNKDNQSDLNKIRSSAKHLNSLIDDMLDLSKIEAGKMDIVMENIEIQTFIEDITSTILPVIERNGNTLTKKNNTESNNVVADPLRLKQVIINLLSNSAKFTKEGDIQLTVDSVGDNILFTVSDTGIGMTEEQLGRIFEAFTQADIKTTQQFGGTGLGLAISRHLCHMMGGSLTVTSQVGVGSIFTITMSVAQQLQFAASA